MKDCLDNSNLDDVLDVSLLSCQNIFKDGKGFDDNEIETGALKEYEEGTFSRACREKCADDEIRTLYKWFFGQEDRGEKVDDESYLLLLALREYCDIGAYEQIE